MLAIFVLNTRAGVFIAASEIEKQDTRGNHQDYDSDIQNSFISFASDI